jgi:dihydrodipicolinate synthase/N-acetylneuraminate lyase
MYEIGVEEARGKVPLYAAIREARSAALLYEDAKVAVDAKVDLVQIYQLDGGHGMFPTVREQEAYWRDLLDAVDHPIAICIHRLAGYAAPMSLLQRLCRDYKQVHVIDVGGLPISYHIELQDVLPRSIRIFGRWSNMLDLFSLRVSEIIMNENNIIPNTCQSIVDGHIEGDLEKVSRASSYVHRFTNIVNQWAPGGSGPPRWIKMAMKVLDLPGGNGVLRRPYVLPPDEDLRQMAEAFEALHLREPEGELPMPAMTSRAVAR